MSDLPIMPATTEEISEVTFFRHGLGEVELAAVAEVLRGPILTTGDTVRRFEERFADYLGRQHCVGLTSCTGALHLSLVALGIGPGDEVITSPMTFIASATAIEQAGATPVFVDVEEDTGNIDPAAIEAAISPRTKGVLPVHLYGQMCDMRRIRDIADAHCLKIVEDSAHCIEGRREDYGPGDHGHTACFSFYATKSLTSGEGGALVTDDDALAARVRLLRHHGMNKGAADRQKEGYSHWDMSIFGWKYNMDNIQAALLLPQLDRVNDNLAARQALASRYREALSPLTQVALPKTIHDVLHAEHLFTMWVAPDVRDDLIRYLNGRRIAAMVNYRAIHLLEYFQRKYRLPRGTFPIAERIGDSTISLPLYPSMPAEHVYIVTQAIYDFFGSQTSTCRRSAASATPYLE